jgi:hypothetical protein
MLRHAAMPEEASQSVAARGTGQTHLKFPEFPDFCGQILPSPNLFLDMPRLRC